MEILKSESEQMLSEMKEQNEEERGWGKSLRAWQDYECEDLEWWAMVQRVQLKDNRNDVYQDPCKRLLKVHFPRTHLWSILSESLGMEPWNLPCRETPTATKLEIFS